MSVLSPEVRAALERAVLCWLASVDGEGRPNVSPKEIFAPIDDRRVAVANIASPKTARNVRADARVCLSFIDIFVQKGFKLIGTAALVRRSDPEFQACSAPLEAMTRGRFRIVDVILVDVTSVEPIVAPSYRFFDDTTEQAQIAGAMNRYGVRPVDLS